MVRIYLDAIKRFLYTSYNNYFRHPGRKRVCFTSETVLRSPMHLLRNPVPVLRYPLQNETKPESRVEIRQIRHFRQRFAVFCAVLKRATGWNPTDPTRNRQCTITAVSRSGSISPSRLWLWRLWQMLEALSSRALRGCCPTTTLKPGVLNPGFQAGGGCPREPVGCRQ